MVNMSAWLRLCAVSTLLGVLVSAQPVLADGDIQSKGGLVPGTRLIEVSTLAESGPGSLRAALAMSGPRIIVFSVGGAIRLNTDLDILNGSVLIAGETAPSPVAINNGTLRIRASDVVISHIGVYAGSSSDPKVAENRDAANVYASMTRGAPVRNVIFRNVTLAWGIDENLGLQGRSDGIRIERSLIAEPLLKGGHPKGVHSMNLLLGNPVGRVVIAGSVFAAGNQRNPRLTQGNRVSFLNNVIAGSGRAATHIDSSKEILAAGAIDIIGNVYVPGADTLCRQPHIGIHPEFFAREPQTAVHLADNVMSGPKADCGRLPPGVEPEKLAPSPAHQVPSWRLRPAAAILPDTLAQAGAFPAARFPVDARIINAVRNNSIRLIENEAAVGGFPEIQPKQRPLKPPASLEKPLGRGDIGPVTQWLCGAFNAVSAGAPCPY